MAGTILYQGNPLHSVCILSRRWQFFFLNKTVQRRAICRQKCKIYSGDAKEILSILFWPPRPFNLGPPLLLYLWILTPSFGKIYKNYSSSFQLKKRDVQIRHNLWFSLILSSLTWPMWLKGLVDESYEKFIIIWHKFLFILVQLYRSVSLCH